MKCKDCGIGLKWHPNKGFYCTIPNCYPNNTVEDVKELYEYVTGGKAAYENYIKKELQHE